MKLLRCLLLLPLCAGILSAQSGAGGSATRPKITGLAKVAFKTSDLGKARSFYQEYLGLNVVDAPQGAAAAHVRVNDRQIVELVAAPNVPLDFPRLDHVAFAVEDVEMMRMYLKSRGIAVPEKLTKNVAGDLSFRVRDPNENVIEFVPRQVVSVAASPAAISSRLMHVGVAIGDLDAALHFYGDVLGFSEFWRGSGNPQSLSWVNVRVPDGNDYVEFMLYQEWPASDRLRGSEHICLEVPDMVKSEAELKGRALAPNGRALANIRTGVNGKRQLNLYDPDGTRVELMEPNTIDGKPRPPSTAPARTGEPRPAAAKL